MNHNDFMHCTSSITPQGMLPIPLDRNLYLNGYINIESCSKIEQRIRDIEISDSALNKLYDIYGINYFPKPINIFINTYGGEVRPALGLCSVIKTSTTPITTIVTGTAMSAGFLIAINGHTRLAYEYSTMMYHQLSHATSGMLQEMAECVEENARLDKMMLMMVSGRTKLTQKILQQIHDRKKDKYFMANEALSYGIIDKIIK